jgi:hypothetical protein
LFLEVVGSWCVHHARIHRTALLPPSGESSVPDCSISVCGKLTRSL